MGKRKRRGDGIMPPRKLRKRKSKTEGDHNISDRLLLDDIKSIISGMKNESVMRRIITKLSIDQNLSNLWFSLGLLLSEEGEYEIANEVLNRVVRLNPDHKKLWTSKANALMKMGRNEEASVCFKKSLESFCGQLDGYNDIKELAKEIKERKKQLGLEDFDDETIDFLTSNILDLDSFITELEILIRHIDYENGKEDVKGLSYKLNELENMGDSTSAFLSALLGLKKVKK